MKKGSYFLLLLSIAFAGKGQNLVPNGSFETFTACPVSYNQVPNATPWFNPALLSPDYYNQCASSSLVSVPNNNYGSQQAHSGNAYCGIYASQFEAGPNVREYISTPLLQTLQSGITYLIQFYINLSDKSLFALTSIGAYVSVNNTVPLNGWIINAVPQVVNSTGALTDKNNWMLISGIFTAAGNEHYIIIGNFLDDANCGIQNAAGGIDSNAYYYIDDVSLTPVTAIEEQNQQEDIKIYPNPVKDELTISGLPGEKEIKITDILAKEIYRNQFLTSDFRIPVSNFKSGIYFIEINAGKNSYRKKFLKE